MPKVAITKQFSIPIGHRLLNYEGPCHNIHGHNIKIEFTFSKNATDIKEDGFVIDFNKIKEELGQWVDKYFDHAFIVHPLDDEVIRFLKKSKTKFFENPTGEPTMENIAIVIAAQAKSFAYKFRLNLDKLRLYESDTAWVDVENNY